MSLLLRESIGIFKRKSPLTGEAGGGWTCCKSPNEVFPRRWMSSQRLRKGQPQRRSLGQRPPSRACLPARGQGDNGDPPKSGSPSGDRHCDSLPG